MAKKTVSKKPTKKSQITKDFIDNFVMSCSETSDIEKVKKCIEIKKKYTKFENFEKKNGEKELRKVEDWKKIKKEFIDEFFPELNNNVVVDEMLNGWEMLLADLETQEEDE